ncbi:MAG: hypothetical protein ABSH22_23285 [Tepidisphaeraceae bacterium]|jgi:hypothetical protein
MNAEIEAKKNSLLTELDAQISNEEKQIEALTKSKEKNEALRKALRQSLGVATYDYGSKVKVIQNIIDHLSIAQFTQNHIEERLRLADPPMEIDRDRIRAVIWSLYKKHKSIRLVRKGTNRQPAVFEKILPPAHVPRVVINPHANGPAPYVAVNGTGGGALTVAQLEQFVQEKNRRMHEITAHFGVDEATVTKLFQPASRVFEASRGWIKIHE